MEQHVYAVIYLNPDGDIFLMHEWAIDEDDARQKVLMYHYTRRMDIGIYSVHRVSKKYAQSRVCVD